MNDITLAAATCLALDRCTRSVGSEAKYLRHTSQLYAPSLVTVGCVASDHRIMMMIMMIKKSILWRGRCIDHPQPFMGDECSLIGDPGSANEDTSATTSSTGWNTAAMSN